MISTSQQKVDQERFNRSHDRTFPFVRKSRPGKTTYIVGPDGKPILKDDDPRVLKILPIPPMPWTYYDMLDMRDKMQLTSSG